MHDYQISWDYETVNIAKDVSILIKKIVKEIKTKHLKKLKGFKNFTVHPIVLTDDNVGVYCSGTYSKPTIGIDIENLQKASIEYELDWKLQIIATILHELKHAEQEYLNKPFDEDEAEDFADNILKGAI